MLALQEVEFEWIRHFYIQGSAHMQLHSWWHEPMRQLLDYWGKLAARMFKILEALKDAAGARVCGGAMVVRTGKS